MKHRGKGWHCDGHLAAIRPARQQIILIIMINCLNLCQIVNLRFQMWYENLIGLSMIIEDSEKGLSNEVFHLSMDHLIADDETGV